MATSGAVRAGRAYVEFFGTDTLLVRTMKSIEKRLQTFGKNITSIGKSVLAAGTAILAPMLAASKIFDSMGSQLIDMSARTGVSVEALSSLGFAAEQSGSSLEELEGGLKKMQKFLFSAASGAKEAQSVLRYLGLTVKDLVRLSPEDQFRLIAQRLNAIRNPTAKAALAMAILGKSGANLLPMIAALKESEDLARSLGIVMSTEDAQAADALGDAWGNLVAQGKAVAFQVGAALAPALTELALQASAVIRNFLDWLRENRELVVSIAKVAAIVVGIGAGLVVLGGLVSAAATVFGALAAVVTFVGAALGALVGGLLFLVSPVGLVIVALVGLTTWFLTMTETGQAAVQFLADAIAQTSADIAQAFQGIKDSLAAGDLGQAVKVAAAFVNLEWTRMTTFLTRQWNEFGKMFVNTAVDIAKKVAKIFIEMSKQIALAMLKSIDLLEAISGKRILSDEAKKGFQKIIPFAARGLNALAGGSLEAFRDNSIAGFDASTEQAQKDLDEARKGFNGATKEAERKKNELKLPGARGTSPLVPELRGLDTLKTAVAGTFSGAAAAGLGGTGKVESLIGESNKYLKKIANKNTGLGFA